MWEAQTKFRRSAKVAMLWSIISLSSDGRPSSLEGGEGIMVDCWNLTRMVLLAMNGRSYGLEWRFDMMVGCWMLTSMMLLAKVGALHRSTTSVHLGPWFLSYRLLLLNTNKRSKLWVNIMPRGSGVGNSWPSRNVEEKAYSTFCGFSFPLGQYGNSYELENWIASLKTLGKRVCVLYYSSAKSYLYLLVDVAHVNCDFEIRHSESCYASGREACLAFVERITFRLVRWCASPSYVFFKRRDVSPATVTSPPTPYLRTRRSSQRSSKKS